MANKIAGVMRREEAKIYRTKHPPTHIQKRFTLIQKYYKEAGPVARGRDRSSRIGHGLAFAIYRG